MSLSKNPAAYPDVRLAFDRALVSPVRLTFTTEKDAVRWRARAYFFRSLLRAPSGYEQITIRRETPLVLTIETFASTFQMEDAVSGEAISTTPPTPEPSSPSFAYDPYELTQEDEALLDSIRRDIFGGS